MRTRVLLALSILVLFCVTMLPTQTLARGFGGGGGRSFGGGGRSFGGGSRSSYGSGSRSYRTAGGRTITDRPAFHYGSFASRSQNGRFYRVVNGKYTDSRIVGRISNTVPSQYLRSASFNGKTYRWDSRSGFSGRIYQANRTSYLGGPSEAGPRLTQPYVPSSVFHTNYFPGYGYGGGFYGGSWYGPTLTDLFVWHYLFTGSWFGGSSQQQTTSSWNTAVQTAPAVTQTTTTPCDYYDANGHQVHVTVAGSSCPVTTDTSTPPPDGVTATPDGSSDDDNS